MSNTQGDRPVSRKAQIIVGSAVIAVIASVATGVGVAAHNAQVHADAVHAMTVAAPAYEGAISLGGNLDDLNAQSVAAKVAYDEEQARIAAEKAAAAQKAAEEAAAAQAAAQQAAAEQAAAQQQAATQQSAAQSRDSNDAPTASGPVKCPAGSQANSGDGPNDTSCLPEICFHIQLPDPAHPDCETPFKP